MTIQTQTWESTLLSFAYEALHHGASPHDASQLDTSQHDPAEKRPLFDDGLLNEAYTYCSDVTATHSRSFHLASSLLPLEKRRAVRALYSFCRISDDIVDAAIEKEFVDNAFAGDTFTRETLSSQTCTNDLSGTISHELEQWRQRTLMGSPDLDDPIAVAWADARSRYQVPQKYAVQLIDGVARDLYQSRYSDFAELAAYCYGVASTVGLMSMHIIGFTGDEAMPYAIKLGVALQLTNILRDIAEDFQAGRVYLPQDELHEFGLSDAHIGTGVATGSVADNWRSFMAFQIERNRQLYQDAMPGIKMLNKDGRFAIAAAADLYRGILSDIEKHDYNIFTRRAHVSGRKKLAMLPGIWLRSR